MIGIVREKDMFGSLHAGDIEAPIFIKEEAQFSPGNNIWNNKDLWNDIRPNGRLTENVFKRIFANSNPIPDLKAQKLFEMTKLRYFSDKRQDTVKKRATISWI